MNDRLGLRTKLSEGVNMGHNIVPYKLFALLSNRVINIVLVSLHFGNLLIGNVKP